MQIGIRKVVSITSGIETRICSIKIERNQQRHKERNNRCPEGGKAGVFICRFIFALGQQNGDNAKQRQEGCDRKHRPIH